MTDIRILSCPQCGFPKIRDCGNGLYQCDDCGTHFDKNENIVLTEQEYIQTCNTEQLAKTILEMCDYKPCFACGIGYCDDEDWCHVYSDEAREFVLEWLKQPHTREEKEK